MNRHYPWLAPRWLRETPTGFNQTAQGLEPWVKIIDYHDPDYREPIIVIPKPQRGLITTPLGLIQSRWDCECKMCSITQGSRTLGYWSNAIGVKRKGGFPGAGTLA